MLFVFFSANTIHSYEPLHVVIWRDKKRGTQVFRVLFNTIPCSDCILKMLCALFGDCFRQCSAIFRDCYMLLLNLRSAMPTGFSLNYCCDMFRHLCYGTIVLKLFCANEQMVVGHLQITQAMVSICWHCLRH